MKKYGEGEITYLGRPLELRPDRELRYCLGERHTEVPMHLQHCADVTGDERDSWCEQLVKDGVLTLKRLNGWFLEGAGVHLSPWSFVCHYFTSCDFAREYKELNFKYVQYGPISICQVKE